MTDNLRRVSKRAVATGKVFLNGHGDHPSERQLKRAAECLWGASFMAEGDSRAWLEYLSETAYELSRHQGNVAA